MYIKVKAVAGVKKEKLEQIKPDTFLISVKEKAKKNWANEKILEILANHLKVNLRDVKIINGHHSPSKLISINKK